jgi:hypothetical protein
MDSLPPREDIREINNTRDGRKNRQALSNLREAVVDAKYQAMWPTPRTTGMDGGSNSRKAAKARGMWPTPTAGDSKNAANKTAVRKDGSNHHSGTTLVDYARMWPTPCASEARQGFQNRNNGKKGTQESLSTVVQGGPAAQVGGSLNPQWVSWLMGFPVDWCDLPGESQQEPQTESTNCDASETQ